MGQLLDCALESANFMLLFTDPVEDKGREKSLGIGGEPVDVITGARDSANVEIVTGLKPGDTVLVTGLLSLRPDSKVILGKIINSPASGSSNKVEQAKKPK